MATDDEPEPDADVPLDLPDLADLSFAQLRARAGTVLDEVIQRLRTEMEQPKDAVAGFQSSI